jgi:hypothetical protein
MTNIEAWLKLCSILGVDGDCLDKVDIYLAAVRKSVELEPERQHVWLLASDVRNASVPCMGVRGFVLNMAPWEYLPGGSGLWNGLVKFLERYAAARQPRPRVWLAGNEVVTEGLTMDDLAAGSLDGVIRAWRVSKL